MTMPHCLHFSQTCLRLTSDADNPGANLGGYIMADDVLHPHVAFATRYGSPTSDFLSASVALSRLEILIDDVTRLKSTLDERDLASERWYPWFGYEVISYYAIGYVTCLEWHSRSRLVDLFTYK